MSNHHGLQNWLHSIIYLLPLASLSGANGDRIPGKAEPQKRYIVLVGLRDDNVASLVYSILHVREIWLAQFFTLTNVAKAILLRSLCTSWIIFWSNFETCFSSWRLEGLTGAGVGVGDNFSANFLLTVSAFPFRFTEVSITWISCLWVSRLCFLMDRLVISEHFCFPSETLELYLPFPSNQF